MNDLLEYKCPACGGALEFDSTLQKMKCPYCDSTFDVEELQDKDNTLDEAESTSGAWSMPSNEWEDGETDNMSVFTCNSCGGEIVADENLAASECPFCGNQVVMSGRFKGRLKPDVVIPFKLDKKMAKQKYQEHIKNKPLLPKQFKSENHIDEIKGLYVPFWLFDSDIEADATFEAENVRHWSDKNYDYTEVSTYHEYRAGTMSFENIPCDGSSKMDDDLMESIEPFDFSEAVPFQTAYLAGYFADKYDVDEYENERRANDRILDSAIDVLEDSIERIYTTIKHPPVDAVNVDNDGYGLLASPFARMRVLGGNVKYALYPVWLLTSTYKGQKYTFAMNGQTGKFVGDLPIDKKKAFLAFIGSFIPSTIVASIIAMLLLN